MKKPEELIKRGEGNFLHCTDYDDAIEAMKIHSKELAIKFARWCGHNGYFYLGDLAGRDEWRKYVKLGYEYKTTAELYDQFLIYYFKTNQ